MYARQTRSTSTRRAACLRNACGVVRIGRSGIPPQEHRAPATRTRKLQASKLELPRPQIQIEARASKNISTATGRERGHPPSTIGSAAKQSALGTQHSLRTATGGERGRPPSTISTATSRGRGAVLTSTTMADRRPERCPNDALPESETHRYIVIFSCSRHHRSRTRRSSSVSAWGWRCSGGRRVLASGSAS